ncbi:MAG: hypothetical protein Ct9H300mP13_3900 [Gammaproteobacteria bacterium]|nr:MAG: hypothetical protein Ct9H300mP13_3900 [Gammaproteobacteria bacterium]
MKVFAPFSRSSDFKKIGQNVIVRPANIPHLCPVVVIQRLTTDVQMPEMGNGPTQDFPSRKKDDLSLMVGLAQLLAPVKPRMVKGFHEPGARVHKGADQNHLPRGPVRIRWSVLSSGLQAHSQQTPGPTIINRKCLVVSEPFNVYLLDSCRLWCADHMASLSPVDRALRDV